MPDKYSKYHHTDCKPYTWLARPGAKAYDVCSDTYAEKRRVAELEEEREEQKCRQEREQRNLFNASYRRPPHLDATKIIPRGVQILAEDPYDLKQGFPYHSFLGKGDISIDGWNHVVQSILGKFEHCGGPKYHFPEANNFEIHTLACNIEYILDNVAEQDISFFRPRGFIMRMDMPGEQEFGLEFMDLYVGRYGQKKFDALPHNLTQDFKLVPGDHECLSTRKPEFCTICSRSAESSQKIRNRHRYDIHQKFFNGTRIVIDSLSVLEDPETARKRGWTNWIQQCSDAAAKKPVAAKNDQDKPLPLPRDGTVMLRPVLGPSDNELFYFRRLDEYLAAKRESPLSERVFRWPPSKQIFYDRWRGHSTHASEPSGIVLPTHFFHGMKLEWIPWADSMDKRMQSQRKPPTVVPADGIGIIELPRDKRGAKQVRKDKDSKRSARALPSLKSELYDEYLQVHSAYCEAFFDIYRSNQYNYGRAGGFH